MRSSTARPELSHGGEPGGLEGDRARGGVAASACSTGAVDGESGAQAPCPLSSTTRVSPSRRVASVAVTGAIEADV